MKKILLLFMFLAGASLLPAFAESDGDFWDEPMKIDSAAKSQEKSVTNQEFEKVMQMFEKKKKKQAEKNKPKGNPVWQGLPEKEEQSDMVSGALNEQKADYPTVMIPVTLVTPNQTEIPPGYYRMLSAQNDAGYFINFYQGNTLVAKIKAVNTGNDYNQKSLNYAKIIPNGEDSMHVIYGDIDCNIEATLPIKK